MGAADDSIAGTVATACQVMAERGPVEHVLGHISARVAGERLLVRCRHRQEPGLADTTSRSTQVMRRRPDPGVLLTTGGIPPWDRSALVTTAELAGDMADELGDRPVVLLRGHGLASVASDPPGAAVPRAVPQAGAVDTMWRHLTRRAAHWLYPGWRGGARPTVQARA